MRVKEECKTFLGMKGHTMLEKASKLVGEGRTSVVWVAIEAKKISLEDKLTRVLNTTLESEMSAMKSPGRFLIRGRVGSNLAFE